MKHATFAKTSLRILYLEDSPEDVEILQIFLKKSGFEASIDVAQKKSGFLALLCSQEYDVILSDFQLPGFDAFGALAIAKEHCPQTPFICVSGSIGEETAIELIKRGAADYILKDRLKRLPFAIQHAIEVSNETKMLQQTEEALRKSEQQFHILAEHSPVGIFQTDAEGITTYVNPRWCQLAGISKEDALGFGWLHAVHGEDQEYIKRHWEKTTKAKNGSQAEYRFQRSDGTTIWVIGQAIPEKNDQDEIIGFVGTIVDITERKHAETAIRESEERYKTLIAFLPDPLYVHVDNHIVLVNPALCQLLGARHSSQLVGRSVFDIIHPEYHEIVLERWNMLNGTNSVPLVEEKFIRLDGTVVDVEVNAVVIEWQGKQGIQVIARDITERKQTEQALRNSEELFRKVFMTSPDSLSISRLDTGVFISLNQGFCRLTGYTEEEVLGKTSRQLNLWCKEDDRQKVLYDLKSKSIVDNIITQLRTKDGTIKYGLMSACMIELDGIQHILVLTRDISEKTQIEEELRISEKKYRSIFENIQDVYYETQIDGTILEMSPSIEYLSRGQYTREVLIGTSMFAYYSDPLERHAYLLALIERGMVTDFEITLKNKDGSPIACSITSKIEYDQQGSPDKLMGTMRNITERKQAAIKTNLLAAIVQSTDDAIIGKTLDGIVTSWNKGAEKIYGYTESDIIGKSISILYPPEYKNELSTLMDLVKSGSHVDHYETMRKHKDGHLLHVSLTVSPIRNSLGNIFAASTIARDITAQKKAEYAVRESERRLKETQQMAKLGHWMWDVKRGSVDWSEEVYKIFQLDPKTFAPSIDTILSLSPWPEEHERDRELIQKATASHETGSYEQRFLRPDKSIGYYFSTFHGNYDEHGNLTTIVGTIQDITERKQTEEIIRESEEKFRMIFQNVVDGISVYSEDLDPSKRILLDCNEQYAAMAGRSREELLKIGKTLHLQKMIDEMADENRQASLRKKEAYRGSFSWIRPDGKENIIEYIGMPVTWRGKACTIGIDRDVTERRRIEEKITEQARMLDVALDAIIVRGMEDQLIYWNKAAEHLYGWTFEEAQSVEVYELIEHENLQTYERTKNEFIRNGFWEGELLQKTKSGKLIVTFSRWTLVYNKQGNPAMRLIVSRDITELKKSAEALKSSNAFNELLLRTLPFGMDIVDEQGKILFMNETMKQYAGGECLGMQCWSVYKDDRQQCNECPLKQGVEIGKVDLTESFNVFHNRIFQINHIGIQYQGTKAMLEVFVDITEQRKLQDQFYQAQKIQSIGTLAGGIAHDFNNILGIILMYSSIIEHGSMDKGKIIESGRSITKAVERGAALVRQILTFARQTDVSFQPLRITDLIREITSMLKETFPKTVEINVVTQKNIPFIHADHSQMHQVLLNLCVNARDAMPEGGMLTLQASTVEQQIVRNRFSEASSERYVCIAVSDTGMGIEQKNLSRIFDPFFTTKEKGKGTGLGLSVIYGILQTQRGFIDVQSEVGHGTTFSVYMHVPADSYDTALNKELEHIEVIGGSETILIVEDEDILRIILEDILESNGYHVLAASDGMEAVKLYKAHQEEIDLVITDMGLPGMTGVEVFKRISRSNSHVKILLASGFLEPNIKSELFKAGAKGFLQKPYKPNEVLNEIRKIIDG